MTNFSDKESILTIDIGGTNIKAAVLNTAGELLTEYKRVRTPKPSTPDAVFASIHELLKGFPAYTKVSVGFPGYVKNGIVHTAPNLDTSVWAQVDLRQKINSMLDKPVIVINDADMQGVGIAQGKGFEILVTLGTGFGTAFLYNGVLLPHIELAHHPITETKDYDAFIGDKVLKNEGHEIWNTRVRHVLDVLKTVFNYDYLYISGGNSVKIDFELPGNVKIVTNQEGIKGGAVLWK